MAEIIASIDYETLSKISEEEIKKEKIQFNGQEIKIQNIQLEKNNDYLEVHCKILSAINTDAVIKLLPEFRVEEQNVVIKKLDIKLKSKNIFLKGLMNLFKKQITSQIHAMAKNAMKPILFYIQDSMEKELSKVQLPYNLKMKAEIKEINIETMDFGQEGVNVMIQTKPIIRID